MMTPEEQREWDEVWLAARRSPDFETKMWTPATEFKSRLLADYDAVMREKRNDPLRVIADAFGWRALARPWAPAGLAAAFVSLGVFTGALTSTGAYARDDEAVSYLSAALEPSFSLAEDTLSWAEQ
jgi:hypothetical protein